MNLFRCRCVLVLGMLAALAGGVVPARGGCGTVEEHFQALAASWPGMLQEQPPGPEAARYHASLAALLTTAQAEGRLDPVRGLWLQTPRGRGWITLSYHLGPWLPQEVGSIEVVPFPWGCQPADQQLDPPVPGVQLLAYDRKQDVRRIWGNIGLGVPLVGRYHDAGLRGPAGGYLKERLPFALTAILRPCPAPADATEAVLGSLELYNPHQVTAVEVAGRQVLLARYLSAPFVVMAAERARDDRLGFFRPALLEAQSGLSFLEPYQPGKIPILFIHGLLSEPQMWEDLASDLRADPQITGRYQLWVFRYPTGEPFLKSAARVRAALHAVIHDLDPQRCDPALGQAVLVGHSMGGLIAKLQVTSSGRVLWDLISRHDPEALRTTPESREMVERLFFFEPVPYVKEVMYIATPHNGASLARRGLGRAASCLIHLAPEDIETHHQLVHDNPGNFALPFCCRLPRSVDLLRPNSWLLEGMRQLPLAPDVTTHSIIGTGRRVLGNGPADGVVPVSSARTPEVETETFIPTTHFQIHQDVRTSNTVRAILRQHLERLDRGH
jgi:pimeloyl-ACP methyl ester carboxylesterase